MNITININVVRGEEEKDVTTKMDKNIVKSCDNCKIKTHLRGNLYSCSKIDWTNFWKSDAADMVCDEWKPDSKAIVNYRRVEK